MEFMILVNFFIRLEFLPLGKNVEVEKGTAFLEGKVPGWDFSGFAPQPRLMVLPSLPNSVSVASLPLCQD